MEFGPDDGNCIALVIEWFDQIKWCGESLLTGVSFLFQDLTVAWSHLPYWCAQFRGLGLTAVVFVVVAFIDLDFSILVECRRSWYILSI